MSLLSVSVLLGSCKEEFLEQQPYDAVPVGSAITTPEELQAAVNGMYASLRMSTSLSSVIQEQSFARNIPVLGDLMADNVYISSLNSGRYANFNTYSVTVSSGEASQIWRALYVQILRANTVINAGLSTNSPTVDQLKGEAYAVRALGYFELVKHFATPYTVNPEAPGVPIVTVFDQNLSPSRNTVAQVYAQIHADLDEAYRLMTVSKNSSYFTKYAAKALQARAYLFMGEGYYDEARDAALDVVNNGGFSLVPESDYVAYWQNPNPVTNKVETIFEISSDLVDNAGTNSLAYIYDQSGYGDLLVTSELYNLYSANDVRRDVIGVGKRGTEDPAYFVNKYPNTSSTVSRDNIKVIRYAEVLLTLAEAYARLDNDVQALIYLNRVATARGAAPYVSVGDQLIDDIITERRKELAFEGHRFWDLTRLNRPIVRTSQHPANARLIEVGDYRRILPIPQGELDANPNIAPNPEY